MQQRTYDFLAKLKVPMLTFGGELIGEAVELTMEDLRHHQFISLVDIESMLADRFHCSPGAEAYKVNRNISKKANYFEAERRITVYNARTDNVILEMEGAMSISNNYNNELVCTVKTGPNEYKKNYIYLNEYTMYVIEDITGTHTDPYHYKLYFHTDILPDVEVWS